MATELQVWLLGNHAGTLHLDGGRLSFQYRPDWVARTGTVALSNSLPLQAEPFDDRRTRPFFAGLLPEGPLRHLLAKSLKASDQDDFALLEAMAGDCAGGVTLLPPGTAPPAPASGTTRWLDEQQMLRLLAELPHRPMLAGTGRVRASLPGSQDKLPIVFDGERIALPSSAQASTHILKPAIHGLEDSVTNEAFCLAVAQAMGLRAVQAQTLLLGDRRFLMVARYDRQVDELGRVSCLHQEDFCQALGVTPEMKYQIDGGPDLAACFRLLRRVTRPCAPQVLRLLDHVVFNALIGYHDAHARNFSLLYAANSPTLAPMYDVMSTEVYFTLPPKMVMKLGNQSTFSSVQARHWNQFADGAGLSRSQTRKRIVELARSMPDAARTVQSQPEYADHPLVAEIVTQLTQRCELTVRRLSAPGKR